MDSSEELQRRRARATPADNAQGLFLSSVLSLVQGEAGAQTAEMLRLERGVPAKVVAFYRYPIADLLHLADGAATLLAARRKVPWAEALFEVGRSLIQVYFDSSVGRTMLSIAGGNPHRILQMSPTAYRAMYSYGARTYTRRGEREAAVRFEGEFLGPVMSRAIYDCGLRLSTSVEPKVTIEPGADSMGFTVVSAW